MSVTDCNINGTNMMKCNKIYIIIIIIIILGGYVK